MIKKPMFDRYRTLVREQLRRSANACIRGFLRSSGSSPELKSFARQGASWKNAERRSFRLVPCPAKRVLSN